MGLIILFLISPIIIGTIISIVRGLSDLIDKIVEKKEEKEKIENYYKTYLSGWVWHPIDSMTNKLAFPEDRIQRIVDMPRLTFERWLTFYNLNPENWVIKKNETYPFTYSDIPYYAKLNEDKKWMVLPIFWSSPEEMGKFRDWLENVYQYGNARIYQQKQEENYKRLVELVENDIKERQDKVQQDLLKMREELLNIKKEEEKSVNYSQLDSEKFKVQNSDGSVSIR